MNYYDEDAMPCGQCCVCDVYLDHSDAGFCGECGQAFCWGNCGSWHDFKAEHQCDNCKSAEEEL